MALVRWEPIPSRLITSLFDTPTTGAAPARRFVPGLDIAEADTHYILRADLPGVAEDRVSVELDGNVLSISGERPSPEPRAGGYRRVERAFGSFRRSVRLPDGIDADAVTATFDLGVLEVTVPKPVAPAPHKVAVTVGAMSPAIETAQAPAGAGGPS